MNKKEPRCRPQLSYKEELCLVSKAKCETPANTCRTRDPNQWNAEPKKPGKGTECVELEQVCPHVTSGLGSPWGWTHKALPLDRMHSVGETLCCQSGLLVVFYILSFQQTLSWYTLTPPFILAGSPKRKGWRETGVGYEAKEMSVYGE